MQKKETQGEEICFDGAIASEIQNGLPKLIGSNATWKTKEQEEAMNEYEEARVINRGIAGWER